MTAQTNRCVVGDCRERDCYCCEGEGYEILVQRIVRPSDLPQQIYLCDE
jgi:hypothetical protein